MNNKPAYSQPIIEFARKDFKTFNKNLTVEEALTNIREVGIGERIVYFYTVDDEEKLVGVLPTRRLLTGKNEQKLEELMVKRVAALPISATVYDACEFFVTYKFLAFPVVDSERRIVGIVDVNVFTDELLDVEEKEEVDNVFESIGFNISEVKNASPLKAWRHRFPWLLATITSGTISAILAGYFRATLAHSLVIAFFLTLMLGLGESVSIQSITVTIQTLHSSRPSLKWYLKTLYRETQTALLIGLSCSIIAFSMVLFLKHDMHSAVVIGSSIIVIQFTGAILGLSVPSALHAFKLDPKIAAGPIALAVTDVCTILIYLGIASMLL
jgi:magnesium transporter